MEFRYALHLQDGEDAGTFESAVCDWQAGDELRGDGNKRWRIALTDTLNGFRAIRRQEALGINMTEDTHTIEQEMAMKMLRAKLYEMENEKRQSARDATRKSQVGTGDRSEKIRTYNFPQDRLTDHRIGLTRHNLPAVMDGDVDDVVVACRTFFQAEALRQQQAQA